jgi:hypothetical protein
VGDAVDLIEFSTRGSRKKRKTADSITATLAAFTGHRGKKLRILFSTQGKSDSFTGLDLGTTDALVCVGAGNDAQRIGRMIRLGRKYPSQGLHVFELCAM